MTTTMTIDHDAGHDDLPVAARVRRLEERVVAAGLTTDEELDAFLDEVLEGATPLNGARMVARAWTDPAYREALLADGNAAADALGFATGGYRLRAVENTPEVHNVVVCTLCSCYPITLLGPSPGWYRSFAYRSRVVREPRAVLAEFGLTSPTRSRSRSGTPARSRVTSWCRSGPRATCRRRSWSPGSPAGA